MFAPARRLLPGGFRAIYLAPVLALVALFCWALASPIGAAPDDDYHLTSIWCADSAKTTACLPGSESWTRIVPQAATELSCFAFDQYESAACQARELSGDPTPTVETKRGNFVGEYPPVFYSVMNLFVGPDVFASAFLMRIVTILLFVGITTALFILLPPRRRSTLVFAWALTVVPLGLFVLSSNNPSSWAVIGIGSLWIALLGYLETSGRRRAALGAIAAVATIMAAGARGDAALYAVMAIGAVLFLTFARRRQFVVDALLPVALAVLAGIFFLSSHQGAAGLDGFTASEAVSAADAGAAPAVSGVGLVAYNLLNVPSLIAGVFGGWGLGWLDTPMPAVVTFAGVSAFVAVGFLALRGIRPRRAILVVGGFLVLWLLPVYVLVQGGDTVGTGVQPRYILPLVVLFAGLLLLVESGRLPLSRVQSILIVCTLSLSNFIALHMNLRRYITGNDELGPNLNAGMEWWWSIPISPLVVWIGGAAAFAALLAILAREMRLQPAVDPGATPSR